MKKTKIGLALIIASVTVFYLLNTLYIFSFKKSPSGVFSTEVVRKGLKACYFSRQNCDLVIRLSEVNSESIPKWEELLIFPETLGYGESGKYILNKQRDFLQGVSLLFNHASQPVHEEYLLLESPDLFLGVNLQEAGYQLIFSNTKHVNYKCNNQSAFLVKKIDRKQNLYIEPLDCIALSRINDAILE